MPLPIHLTKSMGELNKMASDSLTRLQNARLSILYKIVKSIHQQVTQNKEDEELTYIYAYRFLKLLEVIYMRDSDQRFVRMQFDSMRKEIGDIFTKLQNSLPQRFELLIAEAERRNKELELVDITCDTTSPEELFSKNGDMFISSRQLYLALQKVAEKVLVVDIRPNTSFDISKLNGNFHLINIDDSVIHTGMSASILEEKLYENTKEIFSRRDQFGYIFLMDTDTMKKSFHGSKLKVVYDMFTMWDVNKTYERPPFVLDGGYVDFIDMYPSLSTNPHVSCSQRYADLDDLLNLDSIDYPVLCENFEGLLVTPEDEEKKHKEEIEKLYKSLLQHSERIKKIEEQMLHKDYELLQMNTTQEKNEFDIKERQQLEYEREAIDLERVTNYQRKNELKVELLTALSRYGLNKAEYLNRLELVHTEEGIVDMSRKRRKLMDELKKLQVDAPLYPTMEEQIPKLEKPTPMVLDKLEEPIKKPIIPQQPISGDSVFSKKVPSPETKKSLLPDAVIKIPPQINRASKPLKPLISTDTGLNGLVNIRNSCYMNSIIQCLSHIPYLRYFFISGEYKSQITTMKPKLILEFGDLVKKIWIGNNRTIRPDEFYNKVIQLHSQFGKGCHEDANEFFVVIFSHLNDDVAQEVEVDRCWAQQQVSFYCMTQHKASFFIDQFYHQVRTDCLCHNCNKAVQKFDTENVFILNPPARGRATLESLIDDALYKFDSNTLYCKECEKTPQTERRISFQPRILSILLKRYHYDNDGTIRKLNTYCSFPLDKLLVGFAHYKLWGICLHAGNMNAGHYTAVCLNVLDNKWYEFNDDIVRPIDLSTKPLERDVYMLFYQIIDEKLVGFL